MGSVPQIGYLPDLQDAAFGLNEKKRYPDKVFENESGAVVIRCEGAEGFDQKKYEEEKDQYRSRLRATKYQIIFQSWLGALRKKAEIEMLTSLERL